MVPDMEQKTKSKYELVCHTKDVCVTFAPLNMSSQSNDSCSFQGEQVYIMIVFLL